MELDTSKLSKDPEYLLELVTYLYRELRKEKQLREHLESQLRRPRSDGVDEVDGQGLLFEGVLGGEEKDPAGDDGEGPQGGSPSGGKQATTATGKRRGGRAPLPDHLPRKDIDHELSEDDPERLCCGAVMPAIGKVVTEQLEFQRAKFLVLRHQQAKYACKCCGSKVALAPKPAQPLEKGIPGPGLLAQVVSSKFQQHSPLYRQEDIFAQMADGVRVPRNSQCRWVAHVAEELRPIKNYMLKIVKRSRRIHTDDTTLPVLPQGPPGQSTVKAKAWCYVGDEDHAHTVYEVTARRTRDGPMQVLGDYEGYLQADAFSGYDAIYASGKVKEAACWAHAKRKLDAALEHDLRAHEPLRLIGKLYQVEAQIRGAPEAERRSVRLAQAVPILDQIHRWIDEHLPVLRPKSALARAVTYLRNQWDALNCYAQTGFVLPDNNIAERTFKRVALGRKNWMFCGHMLAADRAAVLMSLAESCRRHTVDFFDYIKDVIVRVATHPMSRIHQLTPLGWKRAHAEGRLVALP